MVEKSENIVVKYTTGAESTIGYRLYFKHLTNTRCISVYIHPTSNCQIWSIAPFSSIVEMERSILKSIIKEAKRRTGNKKVLLIDISSNWTSSVVDLFGQESIILNSPYKNTTGNHMTILLINTECVLKW